MNFKLRTEHEIKLGVYGNEKRRLEKRKKPRKKPFTCDSSFNVLSLDGHDKLCGYQNWTFPLGIYGCLDKFSRKIRYLRIDKGTETGKIVTIHAYLCNKVSDFDNPVDSVIYGQLTKSSACGEICTKDLF